METIPPRTEGGVMATTPGATSSLPETVMGARIVESSNAREHEVVGFGEVVIHTKYGQHKLQVAAVLKGSTEVRDLECVYIVLVLCVSLC